MAAVVRGGEEHRREREVLVLHDVVREDADARHREALGLGGRRSRALLVRAPVGRVPRLQVGEVRRVQSQRAPHPKAVLLRHDRVDEHLVGAVGPGQAAVQHVGPVDRVAEAPVGAGEGKERPGASGSKMSMPAAWPVSATRGRRATAAGSSPLSMPMSGFTMTSGALVASDQPGEGRRRAAGPGGGGQDDTSGDRDQRDEREPGPQARPELGAHAVPDRRHGPIGNRGRTRGQGWWPARRTGRDGGHLPAGPATGLRCGP